MIGMYMLDTDREILVYLKRNIGVPLTAADIAAAVDCHPKTAESAIKRLRSAGLIDQKHTYRAGRRYWPGPYATELD